MIEAPEVQETPDMPDHLGTTGPDAEDVTPSSSPAGSHATAAQAVESPTVTPCSPPAVHPLPA